MRILILGGTGLISTGITHQLLERGDEVVHFNRGRRHSEFGDRVTTVVGDRDSAPDLAKTLAHGPFDAVIDMICFTPAQAEAAVAVFAANVPQLIFCSTVDVFTKAGATYPVTEASEQKPSGSFEYAYDKEKCERIFEGAAHDGAFSLTTLRPGATYVDGAVAPIGTYQLYVERIRQGLPIILHGDGSSIWVASHRDDVAIAFVNAIANPAAAGRSYNVTGSELLTWNQYWDTVARALGMSALDIVHIPTETLQVLAPATSEWCVENFQYNNIFDNSAAQRDLGYRYTTTWAEGCKRFSFTFESAVDETIREEFEAILGAWSAAGDVARRTIAGELG